jgi:hypothetical protein
MPPKKDSIPNDTVTSSRLINIFMPGFQADVRLHHVQFWKGALSFEGTRTVAHRDHGDYLQALVNDFCRYMPD